MLGYHTTIDKHNPGFDKKATSSRHRARTDYRAYLPADLSLDALPPQWIDPASYVVGYLNVMRNARSRRHDADSFFPLHSSSLKTLLGKRRYRPIVDRLIGDGTIEENRSYRPGGYAKSFRITPAYRPHDRFRSVRLTDNTLIKGLDARTERQAAWMTESHQHLSRQFDRLDLTSDFPKISLPLMMLFEKQFRFSVCDAGRVHTSLTNLERSLRQHLRVSGQPLLQVDIVNSQPFIFGLTLRDGARLLNNSDFLSYVQLLERNADEQDGRGGRKTESQRKDAFSLMWEHPCNSCLNDYLTLCQNGAIYERLSELSGYSREAVKEKFFAVVYGESRNMETKVGVALRDEFPGLWQSIVAAKGSDTATLPCLMQTIESFIVIEKVCGRIARELPQAPLFSVHDSLATTAAYIDQFKQIMHDEFIGVFGVAPALKTKPFAE